MLFKIVSTCNIPFAVDEKVYAGVVGIDYVNHPCHTEDEIIAVASDADAVVVGHEPYTAKVVTALTNCRLMATPKTGYDNIDVAAATAAGVCVTNTPGASAISVAEHTVALLLALSHLVRLSAEVFVRVRVGPEMDQARRRHLVELVQRQRAIHLGRRRVAMPDSPFVKRKGILQIEVGRIDEQ